MIATTGLRKGEALALTWDAVDLERGALTETGRPMDPRNVLRAMTTAAAKAGLPGVNVHTLRHSAATAWLEACVNIKAVSVLLGHADIRITADDYGHVSDAVAQAAMDALSDILHP